MKKENELKNADLAIECLLKIMESLKKEDIKTVFENTIDDLFEKLDQPCDQELYENEIKKLKKYVIKNNKNIDAVKLYTKFRIFVDLVNEFQAL